MLADFLGKISMTNKCQKAGMNFIQQLVRGRSGIGGSQGIGQTGGIPLFWVTFSRQ